MRLVMLGGLSVEGDKNPQGAASQRRALAVLALLGGAGRRGMSRDKLVGYLGPIAPRIVHSTVSPSFSIACAATSQPRASSFGSTELALNPELMAVDLAEFTAALEAGDFVRAVGLYRGPFLDGFFLTGSPEFEYWVDGERARLAQRHRGALESLAEAAARSGDLAAAAEWWRQLARADPLNARIAIGYMEAIVKREIGRERSDSRMPMRRHSGSSSTRSLTLPSSP